MKVRVSFSDHVLSVHPSVRLSINVSHYFSSSSSEPLDQLQSNLAERFFMDEGNTFFFKMKGLTPLEFSFSKILFSKPNFLEKLKRVWKHRQIVKIEV